MRRTAVLLARLLSASLGASLAACLQNVSTGTGTTDGTSSGSSSGSTASTATGTTVAMGTECGTDPATGVELCLGISTCPSIPVNGDVLPRCGFRPTGSALMDLECECGDALCPIGVPTTCEEVKSLLATATALTVCEGVSNDRCTALAGTSSGKSSGSSSGSSSGATTNTSTCDRTCVSECSGAPDCIQLCGC